MFAIAIDSGLSEHDGLSAPTYWLARNLLARVADADNLYVDVVKWTMHAGKVIAGSGVLRDEIDQDCPVWAWTIEPSDWRS